MAGDDERGGESKGREEVFPELLKPFAGAADEGDGWLCLEGEEGDRGGVFVEAWRSAVGLLFSEDDTLLLISLLMSLSTKLSVLVMGLETFALLGSASVLNRVVLSLSFLLSSSPTSRGVLGLLLYPLSM